MDDDNLWSVDGNLWLVDDNLWLVDDNLWSVDDNLWSVDDNLWSVDDNLWSVDDNLWLDYDNFWLVDDNLWFVGDNHWLYSAVNSTLICWRNYFLTKTNKNFPKTNHIQFLLRLVLCVLLCWLLFYSRPFCPDVLQHGRVWLTYIMFSTNISSFTLHSLIICTLWI